MLFHHLYGMFFYISLTFCFNHPYLFSIQFSLIILITICYLPLQEFFLFCFPFAAITIFIVAAQYLHKITPFIGMLRVGKASPIRVSLPTYQKVSNFSCSAGHLESPPCLCWSRCIVTVMESSSFAAVRLSTSLSLSHMLDYLWKSQSSVTTTVRCCIQIHNSWTLRFMSVEMIMIVWMIPLLKANESEVFQNLWTTGLLLFF